MRFSKLLSKKDDKENPDKNNKNESNNINIISCKVRYIKEKNEN